MGFQHLTPERRIELSRSMLGRKHSLESRLKMGRAQLGRRAWNKGLTLSTDSRVRTGRAKTEEAEKLRCQKISSAAIADGRGGFKVNSGRSIKRWHVSPTAGRVFMQSTYESRYAEALDRKGVRWEKNWRQFGYEFEGRQRNYIPDFYLPDSDEYIETKGYATDKDLAKWRQFPLKLRVLFEQDIALEE